MRSPYKVGLGDIPEKYVDNNQAQMIIDKFICDEEKIVFLVGPSGSGKTVTITTVCNKFKDRKDWIVVNLNSGYAPMSSLIGKLYDSGDYVKEFIDKELNLSKFGIDVSFKNVPPSFDLESALSKILKVIKSKEKKLIVCIDEITHTDDMSIFLRSCLIFLREKLPIYLLMAGLETDVCEFGRRRAETFESRIKRINMDPLNLELIANDYSRSLNIGYDIAKELANITYGFPVAYQALGEISWQNGETVIDDSLLRIYDDYLFKYAYKELLMDLSQEEIDMLNDFFEGGSELLNRHNYKDISKIIRRGIIQSNDFLDKTYKLCLPRFREIFEGLIF